MNCLSVFDHFVSLAVKGLTKILDFFIAGLSLSQIEFHVAYFK